MITARRNTERLRMDWGWWKGAVCATMTPTGPQRHQFHSLPAMVEDVIQPGGVFDWHPHQDIEIVNYVASGNLAYRDQHGQRAGEFGRITAGTGIVHSDLNPSDVEPEHGLTIWTDPEQPGLLPSVEHGVFPLEEQRDAWLLVASQDGRAGSLTVHQDVDMYHALLAPGQPVHHGLRPGRAAWVQAPWRAAGGGHRACGEQRISPPCATCPHSSTR